MNQTKFTLTLSPNCPTNWDHLCQRGRACWTHTDSPGFVRGPRLRGYSVTRRPGSYGLTGVKKNGVRLLRHNAPEFLRPQGPQGLVPAALRAVAKGGIVVCAGIYMSDIPSFPYSILWEERTIKSVANLTRRDGEEFLALAPKVPVRSEVHLYPLHDTNKALDDLRNGRFTGAAVITID